MYLLKKAWLLAFAILLATQLFAQQAEMDKVCNDNCCAKDLTPAGTMISHLHAAKEWMFSYNYQYMDMSNLYKNDKQITSSEVYTQDYLMNPEKMNMKMNMLMAMYGVSDKITVMAMAHYMTNSMTMSMMRGTEHIMKMNGMPDMVMNNNYSMTDKTSGLGDVQLNVLYGLLESGNHNLLANIGINIPTGQINKTGTNGSMYNGQRMPYSMQTGTGTLDLSPGITYSYRKERLNYSAQLLAYIHNGYNQIGYRYGNQALANTWFAYRWSNLFSNSIRIEAITEGKIKGNDASLYSFYEPAANPLNYGGKQLRAYTGLNFYLPWTSTPSYKIGIEYGKTLYRNFNGIQMDTRNILFVNASLTF